MAATTRVGLGNPHIDFSTRWSVIARRQASEERQQEDEEQVATSPGKTGSVLDHVSGLPSPPGTDSDVALPHINQEDSLMNESPPATLISSPELDPLRRTLSLSQSRPSSLRHASMTSSLSTNSLSDGRVRTIRPASKNGGRGGMSRSNSSSSSLAATSLRPKGSPALSSSRRVSTDLSRQTSLAGSLTSSRRGSALRSSTSSTGSRHHHSPSAPLPEPSKRDSGAFSSRLPPQADDDIPAPPERVSPNPIFSRRHPSVSLSPDAAIEPRPNASSSPGASSDERHDQYPHTSHSPASYRSSRRPSPLASSSRRSPAALSPSPAASPVAEVSPIRPRHRRTYSGAEEDQRILEAEERVRASVSRRSRPASAYPATSPTKPPLHRHDSYTRERGLSVSRQMSPHGEEPWRNSTTAGSPAFVSQTPSGDGQVETEVQLHSGGSGGSKHRRPLPAAFRNGNNNLFTPSPKSTTYDLPAHPYDHPSPTAPLGRYNTTSRLGQYDSVPSPSSSRRMRPNFDGLERASSVSSRLDKRRSESISSLSRRYADGLDYRGLPVSRDQLPDRSYRHSTAESSFSGQRFSQSQTHDLAPRLSRLNITSGDSISVVGARSEYHTPPSNKDPLAVLRRMEAKQAEHNRQWDAERSASALGDHPLPRSSTGLFSEQSPQRIRPATSMSSLRDHHYPPKTAPIERIRRPFDESPVPNRSFSRASLAGPSSEPRQTRSYTSLGGRSSASLDVQSASSEHGRLLYEAARSLEVKIPQEMRAAFPEILRELGASARSAEGNNAASRAVLQHLTQVLIDSEIEMDPARLTRELQKMVALVRESNRTSDQSVRDLTRLFLDLPKLLRGDQRYPLAMNPSGPGSVVERHDREPRAARASPFAAYESPLRRSEDLPRPATSLEGMYSPERRRARESLPPNFAMNESRGFVSRLRDFGQSRDNLGTIEDSPPAPKSQWIPDTPLSPLRRELKKKASSTSTHTVRAGNNFMPSASKAPLTAVSTVTAGEASPSAPKFDERSVNSARSNKSSKGGGGSQRDEMDGGGGSPASRFSFHTADEPSSLAPSSQAGDDDDLLSGLVEAQRRREEDEARSQSKTGYWRKSVGEMKRSGSVAGRSEASGVGRKLSVSDRVKKTLGRG